MVPPPGYGTSQVQLWLFGLAIENTIIALLPDGVYLLSGKIKICEKIAACAASEGGTSQCTALEPS